MKELRRLLALFRMEIRLHLSHWRFWFSLLLLSLLAGRAIFVAGPSAATIVDLAPSALPLLWGVAGVILLMGVETAAECRRPGLASILWTKPFSSVTYSVARQSALFMVLAVLLAVPFVMHWAMVRLYWKQACHFEPSLWLGVYWVWPAALLLSSMALWTRTVFDHDVSALGAAAGLAWGALYLNARAGLGLAGFDAELTGALAAPYHPTVGRDLFHPVYLAAVGRTAAFAAFFTVLSAAHLRRTEPRPAPSRRARWFDLPTFRRLGRWLKIDPSPGADLILALAATGVLAAGIAVERAAKSRAEERRVQDWAAAMNEALPRRATPGAALRVTRVDADIRVLDRERVEVEASLEGVNPREEPMDRALFALSPTLEIGSVTDSRGRAAAVERYGEFVEIGLPRALAPLTTETLTFRYSGRVVRLKTGPLIGQRGPSGGRYEASTTPVRFASRFPVIGSRDVLPTPAALVVEGSQRTVRPSPGMAMYGIRLSLYGGLKAFSSEGETTDEVASDGSEVSRIETAAPVPEVQILAGPYETLEGVFGGLPIVLRCYPEDREILKAAFTMAGPQFQRLVRVFGPPPEGRLGFLESVASTPGRIPMRAIGSEMALSLKFHEMDFRQRRESGFSVYQDWVGSLCRLALGTHFGSRLRFSAPIEAMRPGLFRALDEDLQTESIRPTALRSARIFREDSPPNRALFMRRDLSAFQTPFAAPARAPSGAANPDTAAKESSAVLIWRMLRYVLGDEAFCGLIQDLMKSTEPISAEQLQRLAEARYGKSLNWFFGHWFYGSGIPRYEIVRTQAHMVENEKTREIDYDVRVVVANRGKGLMPTPVLVQSERDSVTRKLWLDAGSSATLQLVMPYRPEYVVVDPDGWIPQEAEWSAERMTRSRPMRQVEILDK